MSVRACVRACVSANSAAWLGTSIPSCTSRARNVGENLASLQIIRITDNGQLWRKRRVNACIASSEKECCTTWTCQPSCMHKDGRILRSAKANGAESRSAQSTMKSSLFLILGHDIVGSVCSLRWVHRVQLYIEGVGRSRWGVLAD